jgi:hypothetical protein
MDRRACTRRSVKPCYFVPDDDGLVLELPLGVLDGDPEEVVSLDELGVLGVAVGGGVVGGEADGVRSAGRSPTRPVPLSEQAVARVATSASAEKPSNAFFMEGTSPLDSPAVISNRGAIEQPAGASAASFCSAHCVEC